MASYGLAFKDWALKEVAYHLEAITELRGQRIGIDAEEYLAGLLTQHREPLLGALGGLPFSLKLRVDEDIQRFRDAGITPVFVFNGLDLACKDRAEILKTSVRAAENLDAAWRIYDAGRGEESVSAFGRSCTYRIGHIIRSLQAHINSQKVETFVAPYAAAAQLVEFERSEYIMGIVGSASCLVHGATGVILDFDWDVSKDFSHTDLEKCAEELGVTESQFSDLCLISGYSILPLMPELEGESNAPRLLTAKNMLQRVNSDPYALCEQSKGENYKLQFHKARHAVKHAVSMKVKNWEVFQDNFDTVTSDTHEYVGQRLPNELYLYLTRGLAGPRVLNWRTRMEVLETPPLDGGLSQTCRDLTSSKLVPLRSQSLIMITHLLHRYYQKHDVDLVCWFNEPNKKALNIPDNLQSAKQADYWHVTQGNLPSSPDPNGSPLRYGITSLSNEAEAKKTVTHHSEHTQWVLSQIPEFRPNIVWRFLEHRGYIKADHTLSEWGKSLNVAMQKAADSGLLSDQALAKEIEEAIFIAYELIRIDCLNTRTMFQTPPYSGQPMRGSEADKQNTLLISRIACLGTIQHKTIGYTGPLSRHILAYHQVTASLRGALRDLMEMHACNLFLGGSVRREGRPMKALTDLSFDLPFVNEPDAGLALLVKSYLDELSNDSARKRPRECVGEWFVHALDIDGDLEKVWKLFDAINAGLQSADSAIVNTETKKMFRDASEWLAKKRQAEGTVNGTAS